MLISVGPVLFLGTSHHQQVRNNLVRRAHHTRPRLPVVADWVQAEGTQHRTNGLLALAQRDGWTAPAEQVGHLTGLADFSEMARQLV